MPLRNLICRSDVVCTACAQPLFHTCGLLKLNPHGMCDLSSPCTAPAKLLLRNWYGLLAEEPPLNLL